MAMIEEVGECDVVEGEERVTKFEARVRRGDFKLITNDLMR